MGGMGEGGKKREPAKGEETRRLAKKIRRCWAVTREVNLGRGYFEKKKKLKKGRGGAFRCPGLPKNTLLGRATDTGEGLGGTRGREKRRPKKWRYRGKNVIKVVA